MKAPINKETIAIFTEIDSDIEISFFQIGEGDQVALEVPVVSEKIKTRRDPLQRGFDKILQRYGIASIKYISDVIKTACEKPSDSNILKAKKAELGLQLRGISEADVKYLLMFDFPVRLADYMELSN